MKTMTTIPSLLTVIYGRPGVGKTSAALNTALAIKNETGRSGKIVVLSGDNSAPLPSIVDRYAKIDQSDYLPLVLEPGDHKLSHKLMRDLRAGFITVDGERHDVAVLIVDPIKAVAEALVDPSLKNAQNRFAYWQKAAEVQRAIVDIPHMAAIPLVITAHEKRTASQGDADDTASQSVLMSENNGVVAPQGLGSAGMEYIMQEATVVVYVVPVSSATGRGASRKVSAKRAYLVDQLGVDGWQTVCKRRHNIVREAVTVAGPGEIPPFALDIARAYKDLAAPPKSVIDEAIIGAKEAIISRLVELGALDEDAGKDMVKKTVTEAVSAETISELNTAKSAEKVRDALRKAISEVEAYVESLAPNKE